MDIKALPKASPAALPELDEYLRPFADLFRRSLTRQSVERYVTGLLTDLSRKTCDTIAAAVAGTSTERLQHLLTDADWNPVAMDQLRVQHLLSRSVAGGTLALDDTTFPKQGRSSVGVGRQYCGMLGKIANCQTAVTAHYIADDVTATSPIHWPISAQLFLPEAWTTDPERLARVHVPLPVVAQTKHDLALALVDRAQDWNVPFALVLADAGYGRNAEFLRGLESRQLTYACGVDKAFGVRLPAEVQATPTNPPLYGQRGRPRKAHPAPLSLAEAVIAGLPETAWHTITWRTGSKGPLQKQFVAVRRHWGTGNAGRTLDDQRVYTSPEGWLIAERPLVDEPDGVKYYFCNLPADTALERLAAVVRGRWPIEQFYEEAKEGCGLDDYQGRRWDGFHRHLALVMLAYSFLVTRRLSTRPPTGGFSPLNAKAVATGNPT